MCLHGNELFYCDAGNFSTSLAAISLLRMTALYGVSHAADVSCFNDTKWDSPAARNTGLFIRPSGISELDCATTKTDTAERSISIGKNLSKFFFVLGALAYF